MKNKKGYTLIEIIAVLALISIIGASSFIGINLYKKKTTIDSLNSIKDKIYEAANVYLENNKEAREQLYENNNGVVIPLKVLNNEGLIDFKKINIKNKYVVAALGTKYFVPNADETEEVTNGECLGVEIVNSWDKGDDDKVIYLCGQKNTENNNYDEIIAGLVKRIDELENNNGNKTIYKGENPNNYVYFNVTSNNFSGTSINNKKAAWPSTNKNLWRIYSKIGNDGSKGNIKLIYNQSVNINSSYKEVEESEYAPNSSKDFYLCNSDEEVTNNCLKKRTKDVYISRINNCKYDGKTIWKYNSKYYFESSYKSNAFYTKQIATTSDYLPNISNVTCTGNDFGYDKTEFTKELNSRGTYPSKTVKYDLLETIIYTDWVETYPYYMSYYSSNDVNVDMQYTETTNEKLGVINHSEFLAAINAGETIRESWIKYYAGTFIGIADRHLNSSVPIWFNIDSSSLIRGNKDASTTKLIPVVTLKQGVKIVDNPNCNNDGTEDCPYLLEYNGTTTSSN